MDTPGLREIQLWDADDGIQEAFADVDELAAGCRFNDCAHLREPGCAVQAAIDEGRLPRERLQSYRQLQRELKRLAMKQDARLRSEARSSGSPSPGASGRRPGELQVLAGEPGGGDEADDPR